MNGKRVKIVTTVPTADADAVREALGKAGAGKIGNYAYCSYSVTGTGRFVPLAGAHPHVGEPGRLEVVAEERIEVICDRSEARRAIAALRQAHPYEEPAIDIVPLLGEDEL